MGVDDEGANSDVDQVIERESDQWFLKDRHQRFWQLIRHWPKSCAQAGTEHECLFDSSHRVRNPQCPRKQSGAAAPRNGKTSDFSLCKLWSRRQSLPFSSCWRGIPHQRLASLACTSWFFWRCQSLSLASVISKRNAQSTS